MVAQIRGKLSIGLLLNNVYSGMVEAPGHKIPGGEKFLMGEMAASLSIDYVGEAVAGFDGKGIAKDEADYTTSEALIFRAILKYNM